MMMASAAELGSRLMPFVVEWNLFHSRNGNGFTCLIRSFSQRQIHHVLLTSDKSGQFLNFFGGQFFVLSMASKTIDRTYLLFWGRG
jgi:hypothetical protein